jgi:cell division protein FtsL
MSAVHRSAGAGSTRLIAAAICSFALVAASLSLLVWVRGEILREGYRTHDLRTELSEARQRAADLKVERAALLRPARLATAARALGLEAPTPAQLIPVAVEAP